MTIFIVDPTAELLTNLPKRQTTQTMKVTSTTAPELPTTLLTTQTTTPELKDPSTVAGTELVEFSLVSIKSDENKEITQKDEKSNQKHWIPGFLGNK